MVDSEAVMESVAPIVPSVTSAHTVTELSGSFTLYVANWRSMFIIAV